MVFIIKNQSNDTNQKFIQQICKTMINMEHNKHIYNSDGVENPPKLADKPFNIYTHKQVDYNISISVGVVIIYKSRKKNNLTFNSLASSMVTVYENLKHDNYIKTPINNCNAKICLSSSNGWTGLRLLHGLFINNARSNT